MKILSSEWPVLVVSKEFGAESSDGFRLGELVAGLEAEQHCRVIPALSYEDALEIFTSRADLGAVVIDWDLPDEDAHERMTPCELLTAIRSGSLATPGTNIDASLRLMVVEILKWRGYIKAKFENQPQRQKCLNR